MAKLYIAEFKDLATVGAPSGWPSHRSSYPPIAGTPPVIEQTLNVGMSSAPSNAFNAKTNFIRVATDTACSIAIGESPTATTDNMRLAANQTEYFGVTPGQKIAVIANS